MRHYQRQGSLSFLVECAATIFLKKPISPKCRGAKLAVHADTCAVPLWITADAAALRGLPLHGGTITATIRRRVTLQLMAGLARFIV